MAQFQRVGPEGEVVDLFDVSKTAHSIVDALPDAIQVFVEKGGYNAINPTMVEALAEDLTALIASVVAQVINAGSEREAVMEQLGPHIEAELKEWVPEKGHEWVVEEELENVEEDDGA